MTKLLLIFILLSILLFFICLRFWRKLRQISFDKRSLSTKYGKMTEQFLPFLSVYPYNPSNFRFIGSPIDGLQFEDDKIIFVEFKTGNSVLSKKQEKIKKLVLQKNIEWQEFGI